MRAGLALEIELLTGVYRAALPDGSGAEWPPHPERVLSALVQAWGDGGQNDEERTALKWLERQDPPDIEAGVALPSGERTAPIVYVPPNDQRGDEIAVLPERRNRQARRFRSITPARPTVRLLWRADNGHDHRRALDALAERVASLGHSASLVRFRFTDRDDAKPALTFSWGEDGKGDVPIRAPHDGRLQSLERWYEEGRRPRTGRTAWYRQPGQGPEGDTPHVSSFGGPKDWFVFEGQRDLRLSEGRLRELGLPAHAFYDTPDVLGLAHLAGRTRAALMSVARSQPPPEVISGHQADGSPSTTAHLAFVPLLDAGWEHSRGDLLGFALVLPHELDKSARQAVLDTMARFARPDARPDDDDQPELVAGLRLFRTSVWTLLHAATPDRTSLQPWRYCRPSQAWASVTPVILDRYADDNDPVEEAQTLAAACRHAGLPEPEEIEIHKHSTQRGAPSAYPARGVAHRTDWTFPPTSTLRQRPRRHVVLRFAAPVRGPVLIGAGRYHGFGLCLPLQEGPR